MHLSLSLLLLVLAIGHVAQISAQSYDTGMMLQAEGVDVPINVAMEADSAAPEQPSSPAPTTVARPSLAPCPSVPDALLLIKQCRFFSEIMQVRPKKTSFFSPRSLIVAVTVFCKVPDAESTFVNCVEETFKDTDCSAEMKTQLKSTADTYWSRYCANVDDNIQTLNYLFKKIPVHLVDEQWEVGAAETDNKTNLCVAANDLQDLVINPCARWYNLAIKKTERRQPMPEYVGVATRSSDIGLQCVKRRMMRSTSCDADLVYLMLRALYVFQALPGVQIPLVYLDPVFKRENPTPNGQCAARTVTGIWSNQFVQSVNRGVRYCPLSEGATDLLTTDTVEIVGILNVDQGMTSIDIRFFDQNSKHDPIVWYKASNGQLPTTFTSAVQTQRAITIKSIQGPEIPRNTQVIRITDAGAGQMSLFLSIRDGRFYDLLLSQTDFDASYGTGILIHSCSRKEDIDYKTEVVNLQQANLTASYTDECQDACRFIDTVGYHESCLIACIRRGGDAGIVNSIDMLLGFGEQLNSACNYTIQAAPRTLMAGSAPSLPGSQLLVGGLVLALLSLL